MSSALRRMQRRALRKRPDYEPRPQVTQDKGEGYRTLRPTKGWLDVSPLRLLGMKRMAELAGSAVARYRRKKAAADLYRFQKRAAPESWPSVETRQQRRFAARKA